MSEKGPWGQTPNLPDLTSEQKAHFEAAEAQLPIRFFRKRFEEDAARYYPDAGYGQPEVNYDKGYITYSGTEEDVDELQPAAEHAVREANMHLERMGSSLRIQMHRAPINFRNKVHGFVVTVVAAPKDA